MLRLRIGLRNKQPTHCRQISSVSKQYARYNGIQSLRQSRNVPNKETMTPQASFLQPSEGRLQPPFGFPRVRYLSPLVFGITTSAACFVTAAVIFDRNQQTLWDRLRKQTRQWSVFSSEEKVLSDLWKEKKMLLMEKKQLLLKRLEHCLTVVSLPSEVKRAFWMLGAKIASMSESEKTLSTLIALNSIVFLGWKMPRLSLLMRQWFMHLPGSKHNITLLTSCFSHQEFFHFAVNMVGLWSFGRVVHDYFGREQFIAMYLSAGISANVVSHMCHLALRNSRPLCPSLGASGAIYGLVASTAVLHPNSSISLIFLPMIPIKLGLAMPILMGFDFAGIVLKWKMFDHFAHLAGAGIGIGYMCYGEQYIWGPIVRKAHEIRESSQNGNGRGQGGIYMLGQPKITLLFGK
ncbi:hypothetical protein BY458DRAFT_526877 [Sporodiniella umbellata]|nr:hypothetical protein BY458DRAFT_526877 [Sporodiniella umbellata]